MRNGYHLPRVVIVGLLKRSKDLNHRRIAGGRLEGLRVAKGELLDQVGEVALNWRRGALRGLCIWSTGAS